MAIKQRNRRIYIIILLILIIPLGFLTKLYNGPLSFWINNSLSGIFYEIFWCLVILLILPNGNPIKISLLVLKATSIIECLQLWRPPFLEIIRKTFIGSTLIGTTFIWSDFFYYFIGCLIGYLLMKWSIFLSS
ncbi:MAG: DUF2809 domain-containing protein [Chitinispirillia bacterium]